MKPLISVIVPVYNVETYLRECIESILNQSFSDFELILVDDGSTDSSGIICDEYLKEDSRISVIHKENGGLSSARNAGLDYIFANSCTEFISFIDSDDFVHKDFLKELLFAIDGCDMALCYYSKFIDSSDFRIPKVRTVDKKDYWDLNSSTNSFTICAWNKLYRKFIFESIRYPEGRIFEDSYIIHDIILRCKKIALVEKFLYYYRIRSSSIVHSFNEIKGTIDSLECKLNRVNLYYGLNDKKMFSAEFDDCLDYLLYAYQVNKKNNNHELRLIIKKVRKELKVIFQSKKYKSLHKRKAKTKLFFFMPSLYFLLVYFKRVFIRQ